jgi:hypothetical protein
MMMMGDPTPFAGATRPVNFPHDADIGIRGFGATAAEAFEHATSRDVSHASCRPSE